MKPDLQKINGVGKTVEGIILEILETSSSQYYRTLLNSGDVSDETKILL